MTEYYVAYDPHVYAYPHTLEEAKRIVEIFRVTTHPFEADRYFIFTPLRTKLNKVIHKKVSD